jgi:hypothetical protein
MADLSPEIGTFGILHDDVPDSLVEDFLSRHSSGMDTAEILKSWEKMQAEHPNIARVIRRLSLPSPGETPIESQQRSRDLIGMYMLLDRTALSEQLDQQFTLGEAAPPPYQ